MSYISPKRRKKIRYENGWIIRDELGIVKWSGTKSYSLSVSPSLETEVVALTWAKFLCGQSWLCKRLLQKCLFHAVHFCLQKMTMNRKQKQRRWQWSSWTKMSIHTSHIISFCCVWCNYQLVFRDYYLRFVKFRKKKHRFLFRN